MNNDKTPRGGEPLQSYLKDKSYPGRGILIGASPCGGFALAAYFIMGRSANSRNRLFEECEDGIRTVPFDASAVEDPSLIIYHPVRQLGQQLIVTNGDQTDTLASYLREGRSYVEALNSRTYEPDSPHFTPRISGLWQVRGGRLSYNLSILKKAPDPGETCYRFYYDLGQATPGLGHLIHTYQGDEGSPLLSFAGEPVPIEMGQEPEAFAREIWEALNPEHRVSLYVLSLSLATGEKQVILRNERTEK